MNLRLTDFFAPPTVKSPKRKENTFSLRSSEEFPCDKKNEKFLTIIKMKTQKVFIKIQSEDNFSPSSGRFCYFERRQTRLENGISRFISQFNVSIQNKDGRKKGKFKA